MNVIMFYLGFTVIYIMWSLPAGMLYTMILVMMSSVVTCTGDIRFVGVTW